jgi:uncharacterized LabA/DUF88 family protein
MANVTVFIDGFNVYHSLDTTQFRQYKWLDYGLLARSLAHPDYTINKIFYFTALASWNSGKVNRHNYYLQALRDRGIVPVMGKFKRVQKELRRKYPDDLELTAVYQTFEEKHTDVNIAIALVAGALRDEYDVVMLVSGDTDLVPAALAVKKYCPGKRIHLVVPFGRRANELTNVADEVSSISEQILRTSQLPDPYACADGTVIRKPASWS